MGGQAAKSKPANEVPQGVVPGALQERPSLKKGRSHPRHLHGLAQPEILVGAERDPSVSSERAVGVGAHECVGADSEEGGTPRVLHLPEPLPGADQEMGCNRAGPQHGAGDREAGCCGEVIKSFPGEVTHAARRGVGIEDYIGVGEEQDFAVGSVGAALGRVGLAEPSRREFVDVQHLEARVAGAEAFGDLRGAVGGAVVDEDDLVVRVAQVEERPQGRFHGALLVVGGDDDGEPGEGGIVRAWRCHLFQPGDFVVAVYGGDGDRHPCGESEGREGELGGHGGGVPAAVERGLGRCPTRRSFRTNGVLESGDPLSQVLRCRPELPPE